MSEPIGHTGLPIKAETALLRIAIEEGLIGGSHSMLQKRWWRERVLTENLLWNLALLPDVRLLGMRGFGVGYLAQFRARCLCGMDDDVHVAIADILRIIGGGDPQTLDEAIALALMRGFDVEIVLTPAPGGREGRLTVTEESAG